MSSDWKQAILGDFIKIKHGYPFKSEFFIDRDNGQILLTPGNFNIKGGLKLEKLKFYQGPIDIDYILSSGDIIVSMTDLSKESDTLGYPARIPKSNYIYLHNQRLGKVIFKNDQINPSFLYYLLCSPIYRNEILASSSGTSVKHTAPSRIEAFKTYLPNLNEQKSIADILSSLDDKIELNRQMCKTLEDIASTLFKSWFIDFDPVKAKAAGLKPEGLSTEIAELFPDSFVDSSLGKIPKGWDTKKLGQISEIHNGFAFKSQDYRDHGVFVLRTKNFSNDGYAYRLYDDVYLDRELINNYEKYQCQAFDYHLVMVGNSIGKTAYILPHLLPALRNQNMWCFRPKFTSQSRFYLNHALEHKIKSVIGWASGSARSFFKKSDFQSYNILWPSENIQKLFNKITTPIYKKISLIKEQNDNLTNKRNLLTQKLISGEITL